MKNRRNYYRILHVQPDAPTEVIRSSYRTMMQRMKMHPDLGGDGEEASLINEAYTILRDADARARYDRQIDLEKARAQATDTTNSTPNEAAQAEKSTAQPANASGYPDTESSSGSCSFCNLTHESNNSISPDDLCHRCASPLYPAHKQHIGKDAQRAVERLDRSEPLSFFVNGDAMLAFNGCTQDVSLHGMQFITDQPPAIGGAIKIDTTICQATARVVNIKPTVSNGKRHWQIGVEFLTLRFAQVSGSFVSARA